MRLADLELLILCAARSLTDADWAFYEEHNVITGIEDLIFGGQTALTEMT